MSLFPVKDFLIDVPLVVLREVVAFPCLLAGPFLVWGSPERIGSWKTERHEGK